MQQQTTLGGPTRPAYIADLGDARVDLLNADCIAFKQEGNAYIAYANRYRAFQGVKRELDEHPLHATRLAANDRLVVLYRPATKREIDHNRCDW